MVLRPSLDSPTVRTDLSGDLPAVQTATVLNEEEGTITIFAVNLGLRESFALETDLGAFGKVTLTEHIQLHEEQPLAGNTLTNPDRVVRTTSRRGRGVTLPRVWNVLRLRIG